MEKVFEEGRVEVKVKLKVKLHKRSVSSCMFQWICQYLNNRTARVHSNGEYS